ncbi:TPA: hypothetical protein ACGXMZ_005012 [Bacillus albus]
MNEKYKKRMPKFLPVGIAMGVLFSASPLAGPLTENKVEADVDTAGTIITTFGNIYDTFLREPFVKFLDEQSAKNSYQDTLENRAYKAPSFKKGEFGISVYDFYKNKDFSKKVKLAYPNGTVEYKTIKHGEQLRIKQVDTMVDFTPDEPDITKHNIFIITPNSLNGDTGIALTNWQTFYLKSAPETRNHPLGLHFMQKKWGYNRINPGNTSFNFDEYFNNLDYDQQRLATITSKPVSINSICDFEYLSAHNTEFMRRQVDLLTQHKDGEYSALSTKIKAGDGFIRSWEQDGRLSQSNGNTPWGSENFTITPIKKGSNKVFLRDSSKYIPSELGINELDLFGPDKVWTLEDYGLFGAFRLKNEKGQYLSLGGDGFARFTDQYEKASFFTADLKEDEWNNWLNKWYPGK